MTGAVSQELVREVFIRHAKARPNSLNPTELRNALKDLGQDISDAEFEAALKKVDADGNGTVELDEFYLFLNTQKGLASRDDIIAAFRLFDDDKDGKLTKVEFEKILRNLGQPVAQEEIQELIQAAGPGADGLIDYTKYVHSLFA
jgi:Ca2+-binding EF-hand superfamily protein